MFKIGQTVKLKTNLKIGSIYDGLTFLNGMKISPIKPSKIVGIIRETDCFGKIKVYYQIEGSLFTYSEGMLETLKEKREESKKEITISEIESALGYSVEIIKG